jgi:hypothetical protein
VKHNSLLFDQKKKVRRPTTRSSGSSRTVSSTGSAIGAMASPGRRSRSDGVVQTVASGLLLGLQQLKVRGVNEHPAAPTACHLPQDPRVFQPRERGVDGRDAEAKER